MLRAALPPKRPIDGRAVRAGVTRQSHEPRDEPSFLSPRCAHLPQKHANTITLKHPNTFPIHWGAFDLVQLHKRCFVFIENGAFAARPRLGERRAKSGERKEPSPSAPRPPRPALPKATRGILPKRSCEAALGDEPLQEPPTLLRQAAAEQNIADRVHLLDIVGIFSL